MTMKTSASNSASSSKNKAKAEPWMTFKKRRRTPKVPIIRNNKPTNPNTQDLMTPQQTNLRTNRNTHASKTPQKINLQTKQTNCNTQDSKTPQQTNLQTREQPQPEPQPQPQQQQQGCLEITKLCDSLPLPDNVQIMVQKFLQFTLNNYKTYTEPISILKAFQLSLGTASELTSKAAVGSPSTVRITDYPEDATPRTSVSRPGNPIEAQQVPPPSSVKLLPANRSDHVSMVMELPEQAQQLPYADCSNLSLSFGDHVKSNRKFSGASGVLQDSGVTQQLHQHSKQQSATLPFLVSSPSSRGSLAATLENSHTSAGSHNMVYASQNLQAGLGIHAHAPHLSFYGPSGNHQAGLAPHLLSYRPSAFVPVPYFSEVSHGMPSSSSLFPGFPRSMPTTISQVGTHRGHGHENTRWFNTVTLLDIMNANNMR